jgi:hypothetical protein
VTTKSCNTTVGVAFEGSHDNTGDVQAGSTFCSEQQRASVPKRFEGFGQCVHAWGALNINTRQDVRTARRLIRHADLVFPSHPSAGYVFVWQSSHTASIRRAYVNVPQRESASQAQQQAFEWLADTHQATSIYVAVDAAGPTRTAAIDRSCLGARPK